MISENVFLKQQDTLTWFWLLHAGQFLFKKASQEAPAKRPVKVLKTYVVTCKEIIVGVENGTDEAFGDEFRWEEYVAGTYIVDILIRKISLDPIGLHGQGAIENYIPKFQVATMSLEVA